MTASSHSARDRDTSAVARCARAAGNHIVRLRYANATSTTVTTTFADSSLPYPVAYNWLGEPIVTTAPNTPPTSSAITHASDSCENLGSTLAHWPRCSTVST